MREISVTRAMAAPRSAVWAVLDDFPNIADWNSGVKKSFATGDNDTGLGATRHCDLAPLGELEETVTEWVPEERMVVRIDSAAKLPVENAEVTFTIDGDNPATTTLDYRFDTRFGPIGRLLGPMIDRQLTKGFTGFLDDLERAAQERAHP